MGVILALLFLWVLSGAIVAVLLEVSNMKPERDGSLRSRALSFWLLPFVSLLVLVGQVPDANIKQAVKYIATGKNF